jgi:hypothetical protein
MENFFSSCAELNTCCNRRVNQRGVRKGSLDTANETGFYAYYNDTLALAVEKAEGDSWISSASGQAAGLTSHLA